MAVPNTSTLSGFHVRGEPVEQWTWKHCK